MLNKLQRAVLCVSLLTVGVGTFQPSPVAAQDDVARKVTRKVKPVYPGTARSLRLGGTVRLALVVAPDGKVKSCRVLGGHPLLAVAAGDAAKQWVYETGPKESNETVSIQFDFGAVGEK